MSASRCLRMSLKRIEERQADAARLQAIDELLEVDGARRVFGRVDLDVARGVDREVAFAPASHFVELAGVVHAPGVVVVLASTGASVGHSAH